MSGELVHIEIDGVALEAPKGAFVIDVADQAGISIPRFCYHRKLPVAANCRMCLVEVEKAPKAMPACATPVAEGMRVFTRSPRAVAAQKAVMEFLLINHPLDCPICDQGGECELQDLALGYGRDVSRFGERKRVVANKDLGPLIATDMTRCIHCTRCVRFGEAIAGMRELGATGRGEFVEIGTFVAKSVDSELSGNVIDLCPVGALTSKPFRFRARAWEMSQYPTIAPHDAVGSNLQVHVARNRVLRVVPRDNQAVNEVWISDRDRFSYEGLYSEDRLTSPMVKRDGHWEAVDWESAMAFVGEGIKAVLQASGPEAIGALASPNATIEELYLLVKLLRGLGSHSIDHRLRESDFRDQEGAPLFPQLGGTLAELEQADAVLIVGSNCRKEQPLVNHRIRKAVENGARVMTINPVDYAFNYETAERVIVRPAAMVQALAGVAASIAGKGGKAAHGFPLGKGKPDKTQASIAGTLGEAARPWVILGDGAAAHPDAAVLRALAAFIAQGCGGNFGCLTQGANGAGAWLAGALPHRDAGGQAVAKPGLDAQAMLEKGMGAFVLLGIEPELDCADSLRARDALSRADFNVCLTAYRTGVMDDYADALLPIAPFTETSGTYVNACGEWQSFAAAAPPPGDARPAWRVLRVLGNVLDVRGFDYRASYQVLDELKDHCAEPEQAADGPWWIPDALPRPGRKSLARIGEVPPYSVDPIVRRSAPLQATVDAVDVAIRLNGATATRLGLEDGGVANAVQGTRRKTLPVVVDERVADDCVLLFSGMAGGAGLGPAYGPIEIEHL